MPGWKAEITQRFSSLKLDSTREVEIIQELAQHLEDRYHELVSSGATDEEARSDVLMELDSENLPAQGRAGIFPPPAESASRAGKQWPQLLREPLARPALCTSPMQTQSRLRRRGDH